jgi:hypothetical protein
MPDGVSWEFVILFDLYKGVGMDKMSNPGKNPRTIYNHYVHKLARDAELLLEALKRVKIADSSASDDDSDEDDDKVEFGGKKYYYHTPNIDDRVRVLWELTPTVGSDVSKSFFKRTVQKRIQKRVKLGM